MPLLAVPKKYHSTMIHMKRNDIIRVDGVLHKFSYVVNTEDSNATTATFLIYVQSLGGMVDIFGAIKQ